jgi:hypothetical protein
MNKLYLLSALSAYVLATATTEDSAECDITFTEAEEGDYAYTWEVTITADDLSLNADDSVTGTVCYNDFVYDYTIDAVEVVATADDGVAVDDDTMYAIFLVDYEDVDTPASVLPMADAYADVLADDDSVGDVLDTETHEFTSSEDGDGDEETDPAGQTAYALWLGTADDLVISGSSNNAVVSAASAFTVAAVAGLFF